MKTKLPPQIKTISENGSFSDLGTLIGTTARTVNDLISYLSEREKEDSTCEKCGESKRLKEGRCFTCRNHLSQPEEIRCETCAMTGHTSCTENGYYINNKKIASKNQPEEKKCEHHEIVICPKCDPLSILKEQVEKKREILKGKIYPPDGTIDLYTDGYWKGYRMAQYDIINEITSLEKELQDNK